jgi:hypothetical protein
MTNADEYRMTSHWTLKPGDNVKCKPLSGSRFLATVRKLKLNDDGELVEVEVVGGKNNAIRTFSPDKISRR